MKNCFTDAAAALVGLTLCLAAMSSLVVVFAGRG